MSTEHERAEDTLRLLVGALREHIAWQHACGAHGLPAAPRPARNHPAPDAVVQPAARPNPPAPQAPPPERVKRRSPVEPPEHRAKRLAVLETDAKGCQRCPLHASRRNVVYGAGAVDVEIMIVGEGPGADEDAQGEPFVGKAGKLLDRMLGAMGYDRSQVYIGNIVKCRPPENRTPEREEVEACLPHLREQIELVRPKVIIAMGSTAVRGLLGIGGVTRVRGKWKLYEAKIPVMPTFHPAYLLRNEAAKREVWTDLKAVLKYLKRDVPTRGR